jgi:hypothetical protein
VLAPNQVQRYERGAITFYSVRRDAEGETSAVRVDAGVVLGRFW